MPVRSEPTPNPNAMKFTVGMDVGGPKTYAPGSASDEPVAAELLGIRGVTSIFMTANFVTLTKAPDADWGDIEPAAKEILDSHYG